MENLPPNENEADLLSPIKKTPWEVGDQRFLCKRKGFMKNVWVITFAVNSGRGRGDNYGWPLPNDIRYASLHYAEFAEFE